MKWIYDIFFTVGIFDMSALALMFILVNKGLLKIELKAFWKGDPVIEHTLENDP